MTHFEIILFSLIYLFCYGYTLAMFPKEENVWIRIFVTIASMVLALCAPMYIGGAIYKKLNNEKS